MIGDIMIIDALLQYAGYHLWTGVCTTTFFKPDFYIFLEMVIKGKMKIF